MVCKIILPGDLKLFLNPNGYGFWDLKIVEVFNASFCLEVGIPFVINASIVFQKTSKVLEVSLML